MEMNFKAIAIGLLLVIAWSGCSYEPTKSQYVSSIVQRECAEYTGTDKQSCRISIIKKFTRVSLEEMKATYPKPEPPDRPGCYQSGSD